MTRVKTAQGGRRFVWTSNASSYPVLTRRDRRRLAFGSMDKGHRTNLQVDSPWRDLPGLTVLAEDAVCPASGEEGWLIVPTEAATAILSAIPEETSQRVPGGPLLGTTPLLPGFEAGT